LRPLIPAAARGMMTVYGPPAVSPI